MLDEVLVDGPSLVRRSIEASEELAKVPLSDPTPCGENEFVVTRREPLVTVGDVAERYASFRSLR